jgi:hypothetical protein
MSEAARVRISDNVNQGYIAGRDLFLGDQYVVQETLFFEPDLEDVEPPAWTTTPKSEELAQALAENRLIVLAGQGLDDKTRVARHLAWLLRQRLAGEVRVREWYRSSDPQKIETAFHETATTILLLPQVLPHHVGHRLNELRQLVQIRHNYTVITTEGTREEWGIRHGSADDDLWHEIDWETYYGRGFLTETLLGELTAQGGRLPDWLPRDLRSDALLAEDLTVERAAVSLKQPERIRRFAQWLRTEKASPRDLFSYLDQLGGDRSAIFHWYRQLDRADQLLALGLVLFDGLPDDQIFAALELLVNEAWRQSDPNLPLFDYKDLERLRAYFHLAESGEDGTRIETTSRQKRESILQAAWELQRRRLLAVVPALTRLLQALPSRVAAEKPDEPAKGSWRSWLPQKAKKDSREASELWRFTGGAERELFSSPRRVEQLQRSIIEALSQIGLLSFESVEASFLELAVDGSTDLQTIVAKALAAWRGEGHSEKLFHVLLAWWQDGCVATSARSLAEKTFRERERALAGMRATVALATGYALQYDPPDRLAPELLSLLERLVQDRHPTVRERVLELTLPLAVASHLRQLEPLLRHQITSDQDHLYAIAFGTAMAYSLRPVETLMILERWQAFSRSLETQEPRSLEVTDRDRLLSATALAYGYIRCEEIQGPLTPEQIVSGLRAILLVEANPFVRTHALMAMGLQAVESFELVASTLVELISEVTLADRFHVVSVLVRAYLRQREHLVGGDGEVELGGRTFQVWIRSPRPLTPIETSLYGWLRDGEHPVAQQVALQTLAAIAATEVEQKEREMASPRPPEAGEARPVTRIAPNAPRLRRLDFLGRMAVFLAAPRRKEIRPLLIPLVAEVIEVLRADRRGVFETIAATAGGGPIRVSSEKPTISRKPILPVVLARWQVIGEEEVRRLARILSVAVDVTRWRWVILLAVAVSCGLIYYDMTEWRRATGSSFTEEEERTIRQRRDAPLRMALNLSAPELRRIEELQKLEEETRLAAAQAEANRLAALELEERKRPQVRQAAPMPAEEVIATVPVEEVPPLRTPADRILDSASWMLARIPEKEGLLFLFQMRRAQVVAERQAALAAVAAAQAPPPAPAQVEAVLPAPVPPVRRVAREERREPEAVPVTVVESASAPSEAVSAPSPVEEEPQLAPARPPQEKIEQPPAKKPSFLKRQLQRFRRKEPPPPPGEENNGQG